MPTPDFVAMRKIYNLEGDNVGQPTKEQQDRILSWCGFRFKLSASENPHYWVKPNGIPISKPPKIDKYFMFQYAIPKLQREGYQIDIVCLEQKGFNVCVWDVVHENGKEGVSQDDDLGLALFGAINQVIK